MRTLVINDAHIIASPVTPVFPVQDKCLALEVCGQLAIFHKHAFELDEWYHIAVVHVRHRVRYSSAILYVNGVALQVRGQRLETFGTMNNMKARYRARNVRPFEPPYTFDQ